MIAYTTGTVTLPMIAQKLLIPTYGTCTKVRAVTNRSGPLSALPRILLPLNHCSGACFTLAHATPYCC